MGGMERAENHGDFRVDSSGVSRVLSMSGSFRSAASNASFRSCNSFKTADGLSRASFKSMTSHGGTSYYSAHSRFLGRSDSENQEGVDNLSFFSFENGDVAEASLHNGGRLEASELETEKLKKGKVVKKGTWMYIGCILALIGAFIQASITSLTTLLPPTVNSWILLLSWFLLQMIVSFFFLPVFRVHPLGVSGYRWRISLLSLLTASLLLSLYLSLTRLPTAEAGTMLSLVPFFTTLLAILVVKEHFGFLRVAISLLFLAGVLLQCRPNIMFPDNVGERPSLSQYNILGIPVIFPPVPEINPSSSDSLGLVSGLTSSILTSVLIIVISQCRQQSVVHVVTILLWGSLGGILVSAIGLLTQTKEDPILLLKALSLNQLLLIALVASLGVIATVLLVIALTWVPPGRFSFLISTSILFRYTLELVLGTGGPGGPSWFDMVGGACFLLSAVVTVLEVGLVDTKRWRWI